MPIEILVYDDNEALRESVRSLLEEEPGFSLMAVLPNAETVETDIKDLKPDVVLMDIDMPTINGVEALKRIHHLNPELPIIMLTVMEDNENIFNAIYAGASGYILKRYLSTELVPAIRNVLNNGAPMTGIVAKKVMQVLHHAKTSEKTRSTALTAREKAILQLLVDGYSYKMISGQLGIGLDGVRFHIKNIYDKLHVHSATEAVSKAFKDKLI